MVETTSDAPDLGKGRYVSSHGYIRVLKPDHPAADSKGYVYEHRLVAEENLGRRLHSTEIVHHKNEDKQDNRWENLGVVEGNAEHYREHGRYNPETRDAGEPNPEIECGCGCGQTLQKYGNWGRPREYITGHNVADGPPTQLLVRQHLEEHGESKRAEIADALGMTGHQVSGGLYELKQKDQVESPKYGYWDVVED